MLGALSFILASALIYISLITYSWHQRDYQSYLESECWENNALCRVHLFDLLYRDSIIAAIAGSSAIVIGIVAIVVEKKKRSTKAWIPISMSAIALFIVFTSYYFTISSWTAMVHSPFALW